MALLTTIALLPYRWDEAFGCRRTIPGTSKNSLARHEVSLLVAALGDDYEEYRRRLC